MMLMASFRLAFVVTVVGEDGVSGVRVLVAFASNVIGRGGGGDGDSNSIWFRFAF